MLMINHGFYNFSPQFYYEFYIANGFKIIDMFAVQFDGDKTSMARLDGVARYRLKGESDWTIQVLARKEVEKELVWPTQTKYRATPGQQAPTS
jgi:hypothetical protein